MNNEEKIVSYELHLEDILHTLQERVCELTESKELTSFDQGRLLAYQEIIEIIQTRHQIILDVISDQ